MRSHKLPTTTWSYLGGFGFHLMPGGWRTEHGDQIRELAEDPKFLLVLHGQRKRYPSLIAVVQALQARKLEVKHAPHAS